jgi:hypothetical protein
MVKGRYFSGTPVVKHHLFHLKLPAMLITERQSIFVWYRILVERKHLVRGDVEVPSKLSYCVSDHVYGIDLTWEKSYSTLLYHDKYIKS